MENDCLAEPDKATFRATSRVQSFPILSAVHDTGTFRWKGEARGRRPHGLKGLLFRGASSSFTFTTNLGVHLYGGVRSQETIKFLSTTFHVLFTREPRHPWSVGRLRRPRSARQIGRLVRPPPAPYLCTLRWRPPRPTPPPTPFHARNFRPPRLRRSVVRPPPRSTFGSA